MAESRAIAYRALNGVGDLSLGQWEETGNGGVIHVRRRLSDQERVLAGGLEVRDIRGTPEETARLRLLVAEAPHLLAYFGRLA